MLSVDGATISTNLRCQECEEFDEFVYMETGDEAYDHGEYVVTCPGCGWQAHASAKAAFTGDWAD